MTLWAGSTPTLSSCLRRPDCASGLCRACLVTLPVAAANAPSPPSLPSRSRTLGTPRACAGTTALHAIRSPAAAACRALVSGCLCVSVQAATNDPLASRRSAGRGTTSAAAAAAGCRVARRLPQGSNAPACVSLCTSWLRQCAEVAAGVRSPAASGTRPARAFGAALPTSAGCDTAVACPASTRCAFVASSGCEGEAFGAARRAMSLANQPERHLPQTAHFRRSVGTISDVRAPAARQLPWCTVTARARLGSRAFHTRAAGQRPARRSSKK